MLSRNTCCSTNLKSCKHVIRQLRVLRAYDTRSLCIGLLWWFHASLSLFGSSENRQGNLSSSNFTCVPSSLWQATAGGGTSLKMAIFLNFWIRWVNPQQKTILKPPTGKWRTKRWWFWINENLPTIGFQLRRFSYVFSNLFPGPENDVFFDVYCLDDVLHELGGWWNITVLIGGFFGVNIGTGNSWETFARQIGVLLVKADSNASTCGWPVQLRSAGKKEHINKLGVYFTMIWRYLDYISTSCI